MPRISETTVSWIVHGSTLQHFADDGLAGHHRNAPVAAQRAREEHDVLLADRQVEAEPMPQRVDRFAARLVAEDELRRIAGNDPHQHEDQRQHREQRDAGKRQAADQERGHRVRVSPAVRRERAVDHVRRSRAHLVKRVFSVIGGDRLSEPCSS